MCNLSIALSSCGNQPIGLGVQGLAVAFLVMRPPFLSKAARRLHKDIFETLYFAAREASRELTKLGRQPREGSDRCTADSACRGGIGFFVGLASTLPQSSGQFALPS